MFLRETAALEDSSIRGPTFWMGKLLIIYYSDPSSPHMQSGDNRGTYLIGLLWGITERNASCTRFESKGREGVWEKTQKEGK